MKQNGRDRAAWWNSLQVRLILMMSLALLPIGLIAISQTRAVADKARRSTELALLALVEQSALNERLAIQRAIGLAESIAALAPDFIEDPVRCSAHMRSVLEHSERFSFVGIFPPSGRVSCSSADRSFDISSTPLFKALNGRTDTQVRVLPHAVVGETSAINVSVAFPEGSELKGRVAVSIPHTSLRSDEYRNEPAINALRELVTYNKTGEVLTLLGERDELDSRLPVGLGLANLTDNRARAFSSFSRAGKDRIYTVVPIQKDQLYVLGIWNAEEGLEAQVSDRLPPILFPAIMWITSLVVVQFGIHRLVSRHIRSLRRQMVRFARNRTMPSDDDSSEGLPAELYEMQTSFNSMAMSILKDEASLENAVREKNVLLREVHHRVKNNLQLISSILNMQIREAKHAETQNLLRRVQERVLSLATIHRDLYQSNTGGRVNVGNLLREIIEKSVEIGASSEVSVEVTSDIDDILLYPDQAVPMSLLAAEAATNAIKYVGAPEGERPWIRVTFKTDSAGRCVFIFANSTGAETDAESTGLGARLISAFAIQLGAHIDVNHTEKDYTLKVTFDVLDKMPESGVF